MNTKTELQENAYALINDQVLQSLERGIVPWRILWTKAGIPQNLFSKMPYRGINVWLLASCNYARNFFITENQVQNMSLKLKENAMPQFAFQLNVWPRRTSRSFQREPKNDSAFLLPVYNVAQIKNLDEAIIPKVRIVESNFQLCESIFVNMPKRPRITHLEKDSYYHPLKDFISIPEKSKFPNEQSYYSALFHELVHSTGHISRLGRKELLGATPFGSSHTLEELIVEIGTSYLLSYTGIQPYPSGDSESGINGWIKKIYEDERIIFTASDLAQNAVDFILNKPGSTNGALSRKDKKKYHVMIR